jgi:hypothetical protein
MLDQGHGDGIEYHGFAASASDPSARNAISPSETPRIRHTGHDPLTVIRSGVPGDVDLMALRFISWPHDVGDRGAAQSPNAAIMRRRRRRSAGSGDWHGRARI